MAFNFMRLKLYPIWIIGRIIPNNIKWDAKYLKIIYKVKTGDVLDIKHPRSFNEKIQWLKLYDRKPIYTTMADKYEVRDIIKQIFGNDDYLIPLLGVWNKIEEIDFESLPDQFVLKTTHDSGGVFIINDKADIDYKRIRKRLGHCLRRNYYYNSREWPYKNVKPRIIAEQLLYDESGYELKDYKVFVFSGKASLIQVDYDRFTDHHRNFYDTDWNYIPFTTLYPTDESHLINKPDKLDEMIKISEEIALFLEKPPFIRVDLYCLSSGIKFGEVTFYHGSGYEPFFPKQYEYILGDMIRCTLSTEE